LNPLQELEESNGPIDGAVIARRRNACLLFQLAKPFGLLPPPCRPA
jgi:hypothetical protein